MHELGGSIVSQHPLICLSLLLGFRFAGSEMDTESPLSALITSGADILGRGSLPLRDSPGMTPGLLTVVFFVRDRATHKSGG